MSHRLAKQRSRRLLFNSFAQSFENFSNKSATKKNGTGRPYRINRKKYCNGFTVYLIRPRRFNGRTVLKYGPPRIVFGTFRRYGNAVELPCYGSKTGTLFCPLLYTSSNCTDTRLKLPHSLSGTCETTAQKEGKTMDWK